MKYQSAMPGYLTLYLGLENTIQMYKDSWPEISVNEVIPQKIRHGPYLIILHGLYGSSDNWITISRKLSDIYRNPA